MSELHADRRGPYEYSIVYLEMVAIGNDKLLRVNRPRQPDSYPEARSLRYPKF